MKIGTIEKVEHIPIRYWFHRLCCFDWKQWDAGWGASLRWLPLLISSLLLAYVLNAGKGAIIFDIVPSNRISSTGSALDKPLPTSWRELAKSRIVVFKLGDTLRPEVRYKKINAFLKKHSRLIFNTFVFLWFVHLYQWTRWLRARLSLSKFGFKWPKIVRHPHRYMLLAADLDSKEPMEFIFYSKRNVEVTVGCLLALGERHFLIFDENRFFGYASPILAGDGDQAFREKALEVFACHPASRYYQSKQREEAAQEAKRAAIQKEIAVFHDLRYLNFSGPLFNITRHQCGATLGEGFQPWTDYYVGIVDVISVTLNNGAISPIYYLYKMDGLRIDPVYSWSSINTSCRTPTIQPNHLVGIILGGRGNFNVGAVCNYTTGETWAPGLVNIEEKLKWDKRDKNLVKSDFQYNNNSLYKVLDVMHQHRNDMIYGNTQDKPYV